MIGLCRSISPYIGPKFRFDETVVLNTEKGKFHDRHYLRTSTLKSVAGDHLILVTL